MCCFDIVFIFVVIINFVDLLVLDLVITVDIVVFVNVVLVVINPRNLPCDNFLRNGLANKRISSDS